MKKLRFLSPRTAMTVGLVLAGVSGGAIATASGTTLTPAVTFVSPAHGPVAGGTLVGIKGANLVSASAVTFGGTAAGFVVRSNSLIVATAPAAGGPGSVDIQVTTANGTSAISTADVYSYVTTPAIQSLVPRIGSTLGGNHVVISGSDFTGVSSVTFGGTPAKSFVVDSPTAITAISPPGATGIDMVAVTGSDGTTPSDPAAEFTYVTRVPTVTSVVFDVGNVGGGDPVTITGTRFLRGATVYFGSTPAASVHVLSTGTITCIAPAGSPGIVDVTVSTTKGASVISTVDEYKYTAVGPA